MQRVLCIWLPPAPNRPWLAAWEAERKDRRQPAADGLPLAHLAALCEQFSPTVAIEGASAPESLLLDVTGLAPLFDGEERLLGRVARRLAEWGLTARIALADTVGAAWAMARYAEAAGRRPGAAEAGAVFLLPPAGGLLPAALGPLPVEALRLPTEVTAQLYELGLARIEQLASFSRASLQARFGSELLLRWDQAIGTVPEVLTAHRRPPRWHEHHTLEHPTARRDLLARLLARPLRRLTAAVARRREGIERLHCRLRCESGEEIGLDVGVFRPTADADHWHQLIETRLERLALAAPVVAVSLSAAAVAPLECRQQQLFDDCRHDRQRLVGLLVDRLGSRLGYDAVLRPRLEADAQPEWACRYQSWIASATASSGSAAGKRPAAARVGRRGDKLPALSRPLHLLPQAAPLDVTSIVPDGPPVWFTWQGRSYRVARHWGPERIETGWWRRSVAVEGRPPAWATHGGAGADGGARRDYYRVETASGRRAWLFRRLTDGRWFLHGWFD